MVLYGPANSRRHCIARPLIAAPAVVLTMLQFSPAAAAEPKTDPLFTSHDTLHVEIEAPLSMLAEDRPDEEEFPGKLRYTEDDGRQLELDMVVRTRGRLRRSKEVCDFPPLRLNFRKSQLDGTLFDKQDKIKLVAHCENASHRYAQAVLAEYLAYRVFNVLTDRSFNARLLNVTYVFSDDDRTIDTFAVLIEDKDRLAQRLKARTVNTERVQEADIEPANLNLTSVFQYFIGNTDFSPIAGPPDSECCHNQVLFKRKHGLDITVPYDFDQSGFVDAPHAQPNPRFRLRSVEERLYRGRCINNDILPATLQLFRERRGDIEGIIRSQPELARGKERDILKYIAGFYETIDDANRVQSDLVGKCL